MGKIKALILDAGGVLVHPVHGNWNIPARYRELLGPFAADVSSPRWLDACRAEAHHIREDAVILHTDGEYQVRLTFLDQVAKRMGWTLDKQVLEELAWDFTYNPARYIWYEDVEETLEQLSKRLRLGMLSDAMPSFKEFCLMRGIDQYFKEMVFSTEIGACKPSPRMYKEICRRMELSPESCLFVDDRPCNLEGALQFGMEAIQMCRDDLAPWASEHVSSLTELADFLEDRI